MGVYAVAIPMAAATLEAMGQRFALGFRWSRTNLESIGQIAGIIQHLHAFGNVALQRLDRIAFAAAMRLEKDAQLGQRFNGIEGNHRFTERFSPLPGGLFTLTWLTVRAIQAPFNITVYPPLQ